MIRSCSIEFRPSWISATRPGSSAGSGCTQVTAAPSAISASRRGQGDWAQAHSIPQRIRNGPLISPNATWRLTARLPTCGAAQKITRTAQVCLLRLKRLIWRAGTFRAIGLSTSLSRWRRRSRTHSNRTPLTSGPWWKTSTSRLGEIPLI